MKKLCLLLGISLMFIFSCGPRIPKTKEFPYLPSYPNLVAEVEEEDNVDEGSEVEEETGDIEDVEKNELRKITYIVSDVDKETILKEYEEILHRDGWKTTIFSESNLLEVEKDDHLAIIVVYQKDDMLKLEITSK